MPLIVVKKQSVNTQGPTPLPPTPFNNTTAKPMITQSMNSFPMTEIMTTYKVILLHFFILVVWLTFP